MYSNIKECVKILFQGIGSIIICKCYVSGNVKDDVNKWAKFNELSYWNRLKCNILGKILYL